MELASKYDPQAVESKWYQYWLDNKLFSSKPDGREPYTVVIPPPNVTNAMLGGGYRSPSCPQAMKDIVSKGYGEFLCGGSLGLRLGTNFRVKLHAEYNLMLPVNHSILLAFGSSFFW